MTPDLENHMVIGPYFDDEEEEDTAEDVTYHCAACHDEEVENMYDVCDSCRNSSPDDWLTVEAYIKMCELRGEA